MAKRKSPSIIASSAPKNNLVADKTDVRLLEKRSIYLLRWFLKALLTIVVFVTPLWFLAISSSTGLAKQILLVIMVSLALLLWVVEQFIVGEIRVRWLFSHTFAALFLLAAAVSTFFSIYPYGSFVGTSNLTTSLFTLLALGVLFFLISQRRRQETNYWLALIVGTGGLLAIFSLLQFAGIYIFPWSFARTAGFSPLGSVNTLAIYLALLVPLALTLLVASPRKLVRIVALSSLIVGLVVLQLVSSTLAWGIVLLGVLIWLVAQVSVRRSLRFRYHLAPLVLLAVALFFLLQPTPFLRVNLPVEVGLSRELSYDTSLSVLTDSTKQLLVGSGPSTYAEDFSKFRPAIFNLTVFQQGTQSIPLWGVRFDQAASLALTVLATMGLIGALAFSLAVAVPLIERRKIFSENVEDKEESAVTSGVIATALLVIILFFWTPLNISLFLVFWLCLGLVAIGNSKLKLISLESLSRWSIVVVIALVISGLGSLFSLSVQGQRLAAEFDVARGFQAAADGNSEKSLQSIARAVSHAPKEDRFRRLLADASLSHTIQLSQDKSTEPAALQQSIIATLQTANQASLLNPQNGINMAVLARAYQQVAPFFDNAATLSVQKYEEAEKLEPTNPVLPTERARSHLIAADLSARSASRTNGDKVSEEDIKAYADEQLSLAINAINRALDLKPDYAPARFLQANIAIRQGEVDKAIAQLNQLQLGAPQDASLHYQRGLLYYQQKEFAKAEDAFMNAVKVNSKFANARYFLGLALDAQNKTPEAIAQFEAILELDPEANEARSILANLKAGRRALETISPPAPLPEERVEEPLSGNALSGDETN